MMHLLLSLVPSGRRDAARRAALEPVLVGRNLAVAHVMRSGCQSWDAIPLDGHVAAPGDDRILERLLNAARERGDPTILVAEIVLTLHVVGVREQAIRRACRHATARLPAGTETIAFDAALSVAPLVAGRFGKPAFRPSRWAGGRAESTAVVRAVLEHLLAREGRGLDDFCALWSLSSSPRELRNLLVDLVAILEANYTIKRGIRSRLAFLFARNAFEVTDILERIVAERTLERSRGGEAARPARAPHDPEPVAPPTVQVRRWVDLDLS
jgi:hypothetical protein